MTREGYSRECISVGWWPGGGGSPIEEPAFYAYAYPEPPGCAEAAVAPPGAGYDMLEFAQSTYDAAAEPGRGRERRWSANKFGCRPDPKTVVSGRAR